MEKKIKTIILIAIIAGAGVSVGVTAGIIISQQGGIDQTLLFLTIISPKKTIDRAPTSNHPDNITTAAGGVETINWTLHDDVGPGQYGVWANDSNDNYYLWVDWTNWTNNENLKVPINRSIGGVFNYTIMFNDSNGQFGTPDTVIVTILNNAPTSNHPENISTAAGGLETINWTLYDDLGSGQYRVWANDTNDNYYIQVDWTPWTNNTNLAVPINRTAGGLFNYTIVFNDNNGEFGAPDIVIVNISNNAPTSNRPDNITTATGGLETINWTLYDDLGPGQYRVWANDTNGNYYIWEDWKPWTNNTNLVIPINRSFISLGEVYNYTIEFYDNNFQFGSLDTVMITIQRMWTWVSGSNTRNQVGVYGEKGTAATGNVPGAREDSVSWTDSDDNLWLFGGYARINDGSWGYLNDLWMFNITSGLWTWVSGSNLTYKAGVYGAKGEPAEGNVPGSRYASISWTDSDDNLWLFGGDGVDIGSSFGSLNDLWMFNITSGLWTWVSGSNSKNQNGTYGSKGVPASGNVPGARKYSVSWIDSNDSLWLFGGAGRDSAGSTGDLNDLWMFNVTNKWWVWVSGNDTVNQNGTYGTWRVPASGNIPGSRLAAGSWIDSNDNLWLFGGMGYDVMGGSGDLNDLWMFNMTSELWMWVSGSKYDIALGVYGTKGVPASGNVPGSRFFSSSWTDSDNNLWLFGGNGRASAGGSLDYLNDLWMFNISSQLWTWMSGNDTHDQVGIYGTKSVPFAGNVPGCRDTSISWTDTADNLWLFGGYGYDTVSGGRLNDLWKYGW
ncbi:MAG: Kelch repeat-containing protein [Candidatus Hodarchaeota archaeon]